MPKKMDSSRNCRIKVTPKSMVRMANLEILNIHNTKITNKSIEILKKFKNLKRAYVWGTSISRSEIDEFNRKDDKLKFLEDRV